MPDKTIVQFEDAGAVIYVESENVEPGNGGFIAANGSDTIVTATNSFQKSLEPVLQFARNFVDKIDSIEIKKPTSVELQFGIKLSGEVNFWVVSGQGEGAINLKLTWTANTGK